MPIEKKALPTGQRSIQSFFTKKAIPSEEFGHLKPDGLDHLHHDAKVICRDKQVASGHHSGQQEHRQLDATEPLCTKDWIGKGVQVYWDGEQTWFGGIIRDIREETNEFLVKYVDGDQEWVMARRKAEWKFDSDIVDREGRTRMARRRKKDKTPMIDSSDDDDDQLISSGSEYAVSEEDDVDDIELDDLDEEEEEAAIRAKSVGTKTNKKQRDRFLQNNASNSTVKTPLVVAASAGRLDITPSSAPHAFKTPGSGQRLKGLLDSPMTTVGSVGKTPELAHRFSQREAERFPFLHEDAIKDKKMRRPSDSKYDPSTLHIPSQWFKANKISEGQRQWWEFKSQNFDSVLLFKMGKFYELFEMDAHVGAECLGLSYMKGDQPHVGFPEAAYAQMVERLVRSGHRVIVVEQVETPEMLASRNIENKKAGKKKENVVRREKVAVITKATITDGDMMKSATESEYLACIVDDISSSGVADPSQKVSVALVAVDVASARVIMGQFKDDELRSHLRSILTALKPVEIVIPREEKNLSAASRKVMHGILRQPLVDERPVGEEDEHFLSAKAFWDHMESSEYFKSYDNVPPLLKKLKESSKGYETLCLAMGGILGNLKRGLIDKWVFCGSKFLSIEDILGQLGRTEKDPLNDQKPTTMALDGAALENLEILENADGGTVGTLLGSLDHCVTPFGRRKLREWLCRPLVNVEDITRRQDAVSDLLDVAEVSAGEARRTLAGLTDIERAIVRLCASGIGVGPIRESSRVILYEDLSKKKIKSIFGTLSDINKTLSAVDAFSGVDIKSGYLQSLVAHKCFLDIKVPLKELLNCVDWDQAEKSGRIHPQEGTDEAYDAASNKVKNAAQDLDEYLMTLQNTIRNGSKVLRYTSLNKEPYVLEAPDTVEVPSSWESIQGKKGFRRYMTDELKRLSSNMARAIEEKEVAQTQILQNIMKRFASHKSKWLDTVECIAKLDALMSLAKAAACGDGTMCRPHFIERGESSDEVPVFKASALRHPAGIGGYGPGGFVPNNVHLGGDSAPFMLLTGPNMGGKSTIMRQVCLATIASQIGAWVPAEHLELSPADAVFVRMGAKDHIMLGQSTFFIELSETAAALHRATKHSLVVLDELGRGTATVDGSSIASSVLQYLAHDVCCRGIFATHYHNVAESFELDGKISLKHMACTVTKADDGTGVDDVIFLYQLAAGSCPKSYGANVAKLAGLPLDVVSRAATISHALDSESRKIPRTNAENDSPTTLAIDILRLLSSKKVTSERVALASAQQAISRHFS